MRTLVSEGIEAFSYRSRILRNPFLVGVFSNVGHKIFPYIHMRGGQVMLEPSILCLPFNLMSSASHLCPRLTPLAWSHRLYTAAICQWIQSRRVGLESSLYASSSVCIILSLSHSDQSHTLTLTLQRHSHSPSSLSQSISHSSPSPKDLIMPQQGVQRLYQTLITEL